MAAMTEQQRHDCWAELMREMSRRGILCGASKPDLRAAVDALDTWVDGNAATINAAIPQPARSNLTVAAKALLFMYVVQRRYLGGL